MTICNVNPVKKSALENGGDTELSQILLGDQTKKKRRRKRFIGISMISNNMFGFYHISLTLITINKVWCYSVVSSIVSKSASGNL